MTQLFPLEVLDLLLSATVQAVAIFLRAGHRAAGRNAEHWLVVSVSRKKKRGSQRHASVMQVVGTQVIPKTVRGQAGDRFFCSAAVLGCHQTQKECRSPQRPGTFLPPICVNPLVANAGG